MRYFIISSLLVFTLQGCVSSSPSISPVLQQLAKNRASLLSHEEVTQDGLSVLYTQAKEDVLQLTVKVASLTKTQAQHLPEQLTQYYCLDHDTRKLMDAGIRYHLNILDQDLRPLLSFYIESAQCS